MSTSYKDTVTFDPNQYYVARNEWTHGVRVYPYQTASITLDINVFTYNNWGTLDLFVSDDDEFDWGNPYLAPYKPEFVGSLSIMAGPPTNSGFQTVTFSLKADQLPWLNNDGSIYVALLGFPLVGSVPGWPAAFRLADSTLTATTSAAPAVTGTPGNDLLNGTADNDFINALAGNDTLNGLTGDDTLNGGEGNDTAVFSGAVASYRFAENGAQVTVSGPDGIDTLADIEILSFANLAFSIADRGHFNPLHYLNQNPDVAAAAVDPLTHYRSAGWAEGRDPNPSVHLASVDGLEYIASYGDLMAAFGASKAAGYQHFATAGLFEDRTTTFDGLEYIASYADLIQAFGPNVDAGANHYITAGYAEQREPDRFDAASYLAHYADLQAAFHGDLHAATIHYITSGFFEGRTDHHST